MAFDYTDAPEQRGTELIPADTVATVQLTIRPGGAGEGGLLKRSKDGGCEMLDASSWSSTARTPSASSGRT